MMFTVKKTLRSPLFYLGIFDQEGTELVHINSRMNNHIFSPMKEDTEVTCLIPDIPLPQGHYRIDIGLLDGTDLADLIEAATMLDIEEGDFFSSGYVGPAVKGKILLQHDWMIKN